MYMKPIIVILLIMAASYVVLDMHEEKPAAITGYVIDEPDLEEQMEEAGWTEVPNEPGLEYRD